VFSNEVMVDVLLKYLHCVIGQSIRSFLGVFLQNYHVWCWRGTSISDIVHGYDQWKGYPFFDSASWYEMICQVCTAWRDK